MGLLNKGVTVLNFDETYDSQATLQSYPHEEIDFRHLQHVNLFCEHDSLNEIKRNLSKRKNRGITFIGSGNYHYVTFSLLNEIRTPFTLVLFDNHLDLDLSKNKEKRVLSCGSWVSFALEYIPMLKQVVIIGASHAASIPSTISNVVIFPGKSQQVYSSKLILSTIPTEAVYISIDKDVLIQRDAITNWDHGNMELRTLIHFLDDIQTHKHVHGVDICGEINASPLDRLLPHYKAMIRKNEIANINILQSCLSSTSHDVRGA
ncbi:arginase family protein [Fictibacillus sp. Mic-4]|uniref:arginase family protein n=1 Tax=Fictibacillus TaxID=1329200 RepID=UPI000426F0BE|nr:arginase family protein [Fictibacillus gelatini]